MPWLFLLYLVSEVWVSLQVGELIGSLGLVLEILLSAMIGGSILMNFRYSLFETLRSLREGSISPAEFVSLNVGRMIGAILLILPGVLSDAVGLLLQAGFLKVALARLFSQGGSSHEPRHERIIDVEVIEERKGIK